MRVRFEGHGPAGPSRFESPNCRAQRARRRAPWARGLRLITIQWRSVSFTVELVSKCRIWPSACLISVLLAKYMRRGVELDTYFFVNAYQTVHQFDKGRVVHLMEPDVN